jgi:hypothetical protein
MKIYPNKSTVTIKKEINAATDIALSYVDTTSSTYNISTTIPEEYKVSSKTEVLPYDNVNTNICLFDHYENQIPYDDMVKDFIGDSNGKYYYIPRSNSVNFRPKQFQYKVTAKKNIKYASNVLYNIKTGFYNNQTYANRLMPIFGDAASRALAPGNVSINNKDLSLTKLCETAISDNDITFFMLSSLTAMLNEDGVKTVFDKNTYLKEYDTNFVFVMSSNNALKDYDGPDIDEEKVNLMYNYGYTQYSVTSPYIYSGLSLDSKYYFNIPNSTSTVKYKSLFSHPSQTPILIEEHVDNTFVVYITEDLINNATSNYKVIYEMLVYIYFNSYLTTDNKTEWIADVMPDYIVKDNKLTKKTKFTSSLSLTELTGLQPNELYTYSVVIDSNAYPYVAYSNTENNYLIFSKVKGLNNEYADPKVKPSGWVSLYTNEEIFFYENFVYRINDSLSDCVNIKQIDNEVVIELKPFKHSDSGIFIKYNQEPIIIPLTEVINNIEQQVQNETYYLICKQNDSASQYELLNKRDYTADSGNILLIIEIVQDTTKTENTVYDMRQRGGGLPVDAEDNFDCFDIGNIYGRPYRKAGTLIITLPKSLEDHKDTVMSIVKQYMLAEDYPIIIFKED